MTEEFPFTQHPGTDAETFVQWKGTQVCMDLRCPCGAHCHIDDDFTYFVRCPVCDTVYEVGTAVLVKKSTDLEHRKRAKDMMCN